MALMGPDAVFPISPDLDTPHDLALPLCLLTFAEPPPLHEQLVAAVETAIVPRLLMARRRRDASRAKTSAARSVFGDADTNELVLLSIGRDADAALAFVDRHCGPGIGIDVLYLDLLAPAARRLGEMWVDDSLDFTQVTVGVGRLQHVLHHLRGRFGVEPSVGPGSRCALLAPTPGEQHTFGLAMVADFFTLAGWRVQSGPKLGRREILASVRSEWWSLVGITAGTTGKVPALRSIVRAVRSASRNAEVMVLVGGPLLGIHPDLAEMVGADASAVDGRDAVTQAQHLLALAARPPH
ncbi:MAG: cobalamin B12-binding domain-containing protein [Acidisphaera sp.]|nr:cobalamin B12-binding domain-containing protein [Acidisphaera sp.]MBV9813280.1 cobalamin B12-binding domain-containing protein [Acetobacteraceae bacterium]